MVPMGKVNYLLVDGRFAFRVKRHLREFLNSKHNRNDYINDLIEKDALNDPVFVKEALEQIK